MNDSNCSLYLYLKYPSLPVGQLVTKRAALVSNQFAQQLATKLRLQDFVMYNRKAGLNRASFNHFGGNCIETILAAIFLDGDEGEAKKLFGCLAFSEVSKRRRMRVAIE